MNDSSQSGTRVPAEIRRLLGRVRGRLGFERFLAGFHDCLVVSLVILLVLVVLSKLTPAFDPTWWIVFVVLGGLSLLGGLLVTRFGRLSDSAIAALIDERLQLRDRFSTAIHCVNRSDPFAKAALEDALASARDPKTRQLLAREFSPRAPGGAWVAPLIGIVALGLWAVIPAGDVFAANEQAQQQRVDEERRSAEDTMRAVLEEIEENPELSKELGDVADAFALDESRPDGEVDPEEARREALRRVSELEQRLDELVNGEQGKTMDAMERALSEMESLDSGEARELSEALKQGDFSKANEALEEMQEKLNNEDMTDEEREELAEQIEKMAEELKKAAENKDALEEALRRAGMDPSLANNQQALQQALEQSSGLNQQQMQQLKQMMNAQQAACKNCENMGNAMSQMAQQAKQGQMNAQQMKEALSQAEQMQQMLQQAQACKGQCQGKGSKPGAGAQSALMGMFPSKPQPGEQNNQIGAGFGPKPGGGGSGEMPLKETKFSTRLQKENVALQEGGDIISRQLIESDSPVVGESTVEIQATADRIISSWEEGSQDEVIPAHRREGVKGYLGELTKRLQARRRESAPAAEGASTQPAETTESSGSPESTESE